MSAAQFTEHAAAQRLLVADSFRVRGIPGNAQVRRFTLHVERFRRSVRDVLEQFAKLATHEATALHVSQSLEGFIADAAHHINEYGEGNPRLELWGSASGLQLGLSLRPLPQLLDSIELRSAVDVPTVHAERKGPNIELFTQLNRELGAEALLIDDSGHVIEGATTALIWWIGDRGFVSASANRVISVTETIATEVSRELGVSLTPECITACDLAQCEVWAVNALHGMRPVTSIDGSRLASPDPHRILAYREALDLTWQPVEIRDS